MRRSLSQSSHFPAAGDFHFQNLDGHESGVVCEEKQMMAPYLDTVCLILLGGVFVWAGAKHFFDFEHSQPS